MPAPLTLLAPVAGTVVALSEVDDPVFSAGLVGAGLAIEPDPAARAIMQDAQGEEFKHFAMDLEYLLRRTPRWREIAEGVLFQPGDIVEHGEDAEAGVVHDSGGGDAGDGSLGIGSLRGEGL
jgi:hypothetical protein